MRSLVLSLLLLLAPAAARAGESLSLPIFDGAGPIAPAAHLLPPLALDGDLALAIDDGGGAGMHGMTSGERQALAFILGIIPGFGIGHAVAGSSAWPIWLVVDVVLLVVLGWGFWWGPVWWGGGLGGLGAAIFIVERLFEGYFAYRAAGGRPIGSSLPPGPAGLAMAPVLQGGAAPLATTLATF